MNKRILYAEANYEAIIRKNGYFVDKTDYIEKLEQVENPVFLRPRRFGKSLLCRILECYYNIRQKDQFDELFGQTYIGKNPTALHSSFFVLHLDFSTIKYSGTIKEIEQDFDYTCNLIIKKLLAQNKKWFENRIEVDPEKSAAGNLKSVMTFLESNDLPQLYLIIDEYDNFANQMIVTRKERIYRDLVADDGFLKTFFKTLKEGRKSGAIANVFVTGVLPITIDELASAFNVAKFITLDPTFESMIGFTQAEVDALLDEIYEDYGFDPATRPDVNALVKNHYNGYSFVTIDGDALYNPTILIYFLDYFCDHRCFPEFLTDLNLKTELSWVKRITGSNPENTTEFVDQLSLNNVIDYDKSFLISKFDMSQFFQKSFFPISFFYLGMLTKKDKFRLKLPNLNMRQIFVEYFNELHNINVSSGYSDMMRNFINNADLPALFAEYWEKYISQLPEAIFAQVNENFYRTTFFELCSRHISDWFTWNVERSYPKGKSDLEFVGKFHEKFAGLRYVIEFKYFSNKKFKALKTDIEDFKLREKDTEQIAGYVEGLKKEYPEAKISQFVIYCFGNLGFRVFAIQDAQIMRNR